MANSYSTLSSQDRLWLTLPTQISSVECEEYNDQLLVKVLTPTDNYFVHGYFVSSDVVDVVVNIFHPETKAQPRSIKFTTSLDWLIAYRDNVHNICLSTNHETTN